MALEADPSNQPTIVLINDEEQYSLWPKFKSVPNGWRVVKEGSRSECIAFVDATWTDMRPRSLRVSMDKDAAS